MDIIKSYWNGNKLDLLMLPIGFSALFTIPFVICSFVVAGTANVGFNCVLTGFLNVGLTGGAYHVINNSKAPIAVRNIIVWSWIKFLLRTAVLC